MPPKKMYPVTLKVPPTFLKTLPVITSNKKRSSKGQFTSSRAASPAELLSHYKINTGPKEMSTLGLTMNSLTGYKLDKTSKVKKWTKKSGLFKTFTGFEIKYTKWDLVEKPKVEKETKTENKNDETKNIEGEDKLANKKDDSESADSADTKPKSHPLKISIKLEASS